MYTEKLLSGKRHQRMSMRVANPIDTSQKCKVLDLGTLYSLAIPTSTGRAALLSLRKDLATENTRQKTQRYRWLASLGQRVWPKRRKGSFILQRAQRKRISNTAFAVYTFKVQLPKTHRSMMIGCPSAG